MSTYQVIESTKNSVVFLSAFMEGDVKPRTQALCNAEVAKRTSARLWEEGDLEKLETENMRLQEQVSHAQTRIIHLARRNHNLRLALMSAGTAAAWFAVVCGVLLCR